MTLPTGDDLDTPLGTGGTRRTRVENGTRHLRVGLLGVGALVASLAAFTYLTGDPAGGQPFATARIEAPAPTPIKVSAPQTDPMPTASIAVAAAAVNPSRDSVEEQHGVKIIRMGGGASVAKIIRLPRVNGTEPLGTSAAGASADYASNNASTGAPPARSANSPQVAIIVGGMGLNRDVTADALARLPGQVTLAFAPYGRDLAQQTARARARGHELMLQAPMQPFGYPATDPGPRTLTVTATAAENLERLHWIMGRFSGYVGVMNYLGGQFTADADAFQPVLRDLATHKLIYADDGTSSRSLARPLAAGLQLTVVTTDVVLDAEPRAAAIDAALLRLEAVARTRGMAVGSASGLPTTVDRVVQWARAAQARGIVLIPVSAAATAPQRVSATRER